MDRVSTQIRSKIMASVRSAGNRSTEQAMAKILRRAGLVGYRKQWPAPGKPDFAWPGRRVALFVDGCFWHGCPRCDRPSKSNLAFWQAKIEANIRRDKRVSQSLRRVGWSVLRVWECKVADASTLSRIRRILGERETAGASGALSTHAEGIKSASARARHGRTER